MRKMERSRGEKCLTVTIMTITVAITMMPPTMMPAMAPIVRPPPLEGGGAVAEQDCYTEYYHKGNRMLKGEDTERDNEGIEEGEGRVRLNQGSSLQRDTPTSSN